MGVEKKIRNSNINTLDIYKQSRLHHARETPSLGHTHELPLCNLINAVFDSQCATTANGFRFQAHSLFHLCQPRSAVASGYWLLWTFAEDSSPY